PLRSTLFPYTTLFRSGGSPCADAARHAKHERDLTEESRERRVHREAALDVDEQEGDDGVVEAVEDPAKIGPDERHPLIARDLARSEEHTSELQSRFDL